MLSDIAQAGISALVFGGWAEELQGTVMARPHRDIDLLLLDPDNAALEKFISSKNPVEEKSSSHKRAFVAGGVLVELFIARSRPL